MRMLQRRQVRILLPNKQSLDCTVRVGARGHEVFSSVLEHLDVTELQVFSLAVLRDDEYLFLDLEKKLRSYFGKRWNRGSSRIPFFLFLRVRYYAENGPIIILSSRKLQQLYYTELRQKVLQSQSRQQEAVFFQLAASALQADIGDLDLSEWKDEREQRHYFLPEDYFPSWLIKRRGRDFLLRHCPELHIELRGVTRTQAMLQFIKQVTSLQDGAVTFYRMRQEKKERRSSVLLGVAMKGVHIYQEVEGKLCLLYDFSWIDIDRVSFQGSRFEISAVGSLCLPKLVYYTPSAFHSKHLLRHLSDSHRFHINTRDADSYSRQLEDMETSQVYREAYICDITQLKHRLQSLTSSMSDSSISVETTIASSNKEEDEEVEDQLSDTEIELCVDEPEEFLVDNPDELPWLAERLNGIGRPLVMPSSHWAVVTVEMKQVLMRRADEGVSVD